MKALRWFWWFALLLLVLGTTVTTAKEDSSSSSSCPARPAVSIGSATAAASKEEDEDGGACQDPQEYDEYFDGPEDDDDEEDYPVEFADYCTLYMAPSSIPHAGWGMYTGRAVVEGEAWHPTDVSIQVADYQDQHGLQEKLFQSEDNNNNEKFPAWLLHEYYWKAATVNSMWDADSVDAVLPGWGMLANSHTGLINSANEGSQYKKPDDRLQAGCGAWSLYQNLTFTALQDLQAGHEIFVEYGDEWFRGRSSVFGDALPLSTDFELANALLQKWEFVVDGDLDSELALGVWELAEGILEVKQHSDDEDNNNTDDSGRWSTPRRKDIQRLLAALPNNATHAVYMVTQHATVAYETVPNVVRSLEWLDEHGLCLDHIQPTIHTQQQQEQGKQKTDGLPITAPHIGTGVIATRFLPKGTVVAPAPLVHLSRRHLEMMHVDTAAVDVDSIQWKGHQLLLNYCFGHPDSSVLLFPYSPAVNLINHAGPGETANVAIRWSNITSEAAHAWIDSWSADELIAQNEKAGLVLEFYALRDIEKGEPVLLDYGKDWQAAWDVHVANWKAPANAENYVSAWDYDHADVIPVEGDANYPPSWIQVRCFADKATMEKVDNVEDEYFGWHVWAPTGSTEIEDTVPCRVVASDLIEDTGETVYRVVVEDDEEDEIFVLQVPWSSITYIEKEYTSNQYLRQAFRHEIGLPDDMVPANWRDLQVEKTCGLYMAESAIPNAGLGMYTARGFTTQQQLFYGDVVIQVEDYEVNQKLRHWFAAETEYDEDPEWLPANYFWNSVNTMSIFEADDIESIVPGLGMLANSHMGLVNAVMKPPTVTEDLHRGKDPGTGASTTYNDVHFVASQAIEPGAEIFVAYGDSWFRDRADIGLIPLSRDYLTADRLLKEYMAHVQDNTDSDMAAALWEIVKTALDADTRTGAALPNNVADVKRVFETGTAVNSVPNRVRSNEWLEENGRCLDHIRPGMSTVKQAGRGAFATRSLREGQVIAPMPLVHVRRHHMDIFDSKDVHDYDGYVWWDGKQLLLNYAFGHPESSLLLFPYSPVVNYVNHNSTRSNAKLQWSTLSNHHADWLDRTPDDLDTENHAGLIMEMVATRKIERGEEVFLDYGDAWDEAWSDYVDNEWEPSTADKHYTSAAELNQEMEWLMTHEDMLDRLDNVLTVCFVSSLYKQTGVSEDGIPMYKWEYSSGMFTDADYAYPCEIMERESEDDYETSMDRMESVEPVHTSYIVVLDRDDLPPAVVTEVPRSAIRYFDQQYTSDLCLRTAFRHEIGLPDHMVPEAWRDLKGKAPTDFI